MTFAARPIRDVAAGGGGGGGSPGGAGLALTLSSYAISASGVPPNYTTPLITGTPTGGTGGNTFAWSVASNDYGGGVTFSAPSAAASTARLTGVPLSDTVNVTVRLTVTDSAGNTASRLFAITYQNTDYR